MLLCSIAKTWENVNTDHADVKELIPEFYQTPGTFLNNAMVSESTAVWVGLLVVTQWADNSRATLWTRFFYCYFFTC